jgi:hypothetical protein
MVGIRGSLLLKRGLLQKLKCGSSWYQRAASIGTGTDTSVTAFSTMGFTPLQTVPGFPPPRLLIHRALTLYKCEMRKGPQTNPEYARVSATRLKMISA